MSYLAACLVEPSQRTDYCDNKGGPQRDIVELLFCGRHVQN